MNKSYFCWGVAICLSLLSGSVFAREKVKIAILLANQSEQEVQRQWAPLAAAMNKDMPNYHFVINLYDAKKLQEIVATRQTDFVFTNPSNYLLMFKQSGLSAPLATLSDLEQGKMVRAYGGVIFTRADQSDIKNLEDMRGKKVAIASTEAFGGYQMQAYELNRIGLNPREDIQLQLSGQPHDNVVNAVLAQRADIGFVRSGILESMAIEGKLDLAKIRIINRQNLPDYPVSVSTRLYPDWTFAALPQTDTQLKDEVAAFLLTLHDKQALAQVLQINGFHVPADYTPVEDMLRELHLPPFDHAPTFTLVDVWLRYRWLIVVVLISVAIILLLGFNTRRVNRHLKERSLELNLANLQLQEENVERKEMAEKISNLAFYDPLTGLPNRRLLTHRLNAALSISSRNNLYGALLFLDLDNFKVLNDTLGHDVGDQLLIEAAKRILSCVREGDTVARLGGDEFVMLLEGIDGNIEIASNKVALISEKIRATLSEPYQLGDHIQYSTPSIGVSLYLGNEKSLEVLLKSADIALYQAKNAGRNLVRFFDPDMQHDVEAHAALEADLRQAVSERQLRLYYQIQVDADMHPLGAEALVRWLHPIRGLISPMEFIPVAEESKLILDIGGWVLESACQQLSVWAKDEMSSQLSIAVNVSAQQFRQADFVESVESMLRTYRLNAFAAETGVDRKRGAE